MRYYTNILLGKISVYGRPSCTLFRSRRILLEEEEEEEEEEG
jgi:hypothetical protein